MTAPKGRPDRRVKKLDPRKAITVVREQDLPKLGEDAAGHLATIKTGIDKEEEDEHHLQLVLRTVYGSNALSTGDRNPISIPIPDAHPVVLDNEADASSRVWTQPGTLIRFSIPVEDCIGCPYNMEVEDDSWLAGFNAKVKKGEVEGAKELTEDQFEEMMWALERMTAEKLGVDPFGATKPVPQVAWPTLKDLVACMDQAASRLPSVRQGVHLEAAKESAEHVYEWWKKRKGDRAGREIQPMLKMDDTGTNDPYVCFRRREARPQRKTRRVDGHSLDRIRVLRDQMRRALDLADMVAKREKLRREVLSLDELVFRQRVKVRAMRKQMGLAPVGEAEQAVDRPKKKQKRDHPIPGAIPSASGLLIPASKLDDGRRMAAEMVDPARVAEERVARKKEEDERAGWWDRGIEECVLVEPVRGKWRRDVCIAGVVKPLPPLREEQLVPKSPELDEMETDLVAALDASVSKGKGEQEVREKGHVYGYMPLARARLGRGGRLIYDRRLPPSRGRTWRAGDFSSRQDPASVWGEDTLEEASRRWRWDESESGEDEEDVEWETTPSVLLFRSSITRDATIGPNANQFVNTPRYPFQFDPGSAGARVASQPQLPPLNIIRPPQPGTGAQGPSPQMLQAQQAAMARDRSKRLSFKAESPGPNGFVAGAPVNGALGGVMTSPTTAQAAAKPPSRATKADPQLDPKQSAVKMLMKESAKGAAHIQQIQSEMQRQQQWVRQQTQANGQTANTMPLQHAVSGTIGSNGFGQAMPSTPAGTQISGMQQGGGSNPAGLQSPRPLEFSVQGAGYQQVTSSATPLNTLTAGTAASFLQQAHAAQQVKQHQQQAIQQLAQFQNMGQQRVRPSGGSTPNLQAAGAAAPQGGNVGNPTAPNGQALSNALASPAAYQFIMNQLAMQNRNPASSPNSAGAVKIPAGAMGGGSNGANAQAMATLQAQIQAQMGSGAQIGSPGRSASGPSGLNGLTATQLQQLGIHGNAMYLMAQQKQQQALLAQQQQAAQNAIDGLQLDVDEKGQ